MALCEARTASRRAGPAGFAQVFLDPVELADEEQDQGRPWVGAAIDHIMEVAPDVGEAGHEPERLTALLFPVAGVGPQGVALDDAGAGFADALDERSGAAADSPVVEEAAVRGVYNPQVALGGFAGAGIEVADGV